MEKTPRRLRRFYRQAEQKTGQHRRGGDAEERNGNEEDYYGLGAGYDTPAYSEHSPHQPLSGIPTMSYEDINIDEKNYRELKKFEQKKKEEDLALVEIAKFKEKNKRMPNKEEAEQIAENIYTQLKDSNVSELYPKEEIAESEAQQTEGKRENWRDRRSRRAMRRGEVKENPVEEEKGIEPIAPVSAEPIKNIKSLLEDESFDIGDEKKSPGKKNGADNEFDLGEGFDEEGGEINLDEEPEEIVAVEKADKKENLCTNCKAKTDKIIYCPKCGKAYCAKCAAAYSEGKYSCPSCGTKTKI
ncbi:MAG: hypothetical protein WC308_01945 [archaeon]|jgi:predicted RNA-binding Zn-ribbon protein involved in translation (DUF1610 family)